MSLKNKKSESLSVRALEYAVHGYSVMPLRKDKTPLLKAWRQYQTTPADEAQIEKWWKATPDASIGILTGKLSGITVVDVDVSDESFTPVKKFPPTYTVKTPSGGYHLYYQYAEGFTVSSNGYPQFPHVDIRGDGGYIVAPPSVADYVKHDRHIRGSYKVVNDMAPAPFPLELFSAPQGAGKPVKANDILKSFDAMAEGDGRNNAMAKFVGRALRAYLPEDYRALVLPMAIEANKKFKKPLAEKEVRSIFESIAKKERSKPLAEIEFLKTDKGVIIANVENVRRTLEADSKMQGHFRYNTFVGTIETNYLKDTWEAHQRSDVIAVRSYLMSTYPHFTKIGHSEVEDAMFACSSANRVSPPVEWLQSLVWDKKPRLDTWLTLSCGAEDNVYHKAVSSNWLKGAVKRLVEPGSKFDYVLVLEGKQGIGKSTLFAILGGGWHVETVFSPDNKDFFMLFSGNFIIEFSEGETLSRTEAKKLKAVITMQHDKYRPPYERSSKDFPRQCVFAMTTNQEQYLKDETGNRRWLPVRVEQKIDTQWVRDNREQLFAEAYYRVVELKETVHEFPEAETALEQSLRQIGDPREEVVVEWYYHVLDDAKREAGVTARQAYVGAIQGGFSHAGKSMDRADEMVIGSILRQIIKLKRQRLRVKGTLTYLYLPTPESEAEKPDFSEVKNHVHTSNMDF